MLIKYGDHSYNPLLCGVGVVLVSILFSYFLYENQLQAIEEEAKLIQSIQQQEATDFQDHFEWTNLIKTAAAKDYTHVREAIMHFLFYQRLVKETLEQEKDKSKEVQQRLLPILHSRLLPWTKYKWEEFHKINEKRQGTGIAIYSCPQCTWNTLFLLDHLRNVLGCQLPVEVFYEDPQRTLHINHNQEIQVQFVEFVQKYLQKRGQSSSNNNNNSNSSQVTFRLLTDHLEPDVLQGNVIRSYVLMSSHFARVLYMDSTVVWMQNPETLMNHPDATSTAALFFPDRTFMGQNANLGRWLREVFGSTASPMDYEARISRNALVQTRMWQLRSSHEHGGQAFLIDVKRVWPAIILSGMLSGEAFRTKLMEQFVMGDKETLWLSLAMLNFPFSFWKSPCGTIGTQITETTHNVMPLYLPNTPPRNIICSDRILQTDDNENQLVFFTNGLMVDGSYLESKMAPLTHYQVEPTRAIEPWRMDERGICLLQGNVKEIDTKELGKLEVYHQVWNDMARQVQSILQLHSTQK